MAYCNADLSEEQMQRVEKYKRAFEQHDTDGSGKLSKSEVEALLAKSDDPGKPTFEGICCLADEDNDGQISQEEFLTALVGCTKKSVFGYAFRSYDTDHSGYLEKAEFEAMLANETCLSERERQAARNLLGEIDTDGDGRINLDEYIDRLAKKTCGRD